MKGSVPRARREGENRFGLFFVPCGAPFCGKLFLVPDSGIFSIQINWNLANSRSLRASVHTGVAIRFPLPCFYDESTAIGERISTSGFALLAMTDYFTEQFRSSRPNGITTITRVRNALPAAAGGVNKLFTVSSIFPLAFLDKVGYIVLALRKSEC